MKVAIGVDSHKSSLASAARDELGKVVGRKEFPNEQTGHRAMLNWAKGLGEERIFGIESARTYGAGLASFLLNHGEDVREVSPSLASRQRSKKPGAGKSDLVDAEAIAKVVLEEADLPTCRREAHCEDLQLLADYRDQLVGQRTRMVNRVHKQLVIARPGYEKKIPNLTSKANLAKAVRVLPASMLRGRLVRELINEIRRVDTKLLALEKEIATLVKESNTSLTQLKGVGPLIAARILGEVGNMSRIRSKAAFAKLNGTAPLEASSGKVTRHRWNPGGNRRLNRAIFLLALQQYRIEPRAKSYVERKISEGKSHKEAMRCLKRCLSDVVYRCLVKDWRRDEIAA